MTGAFPKNEIYELTSQLRRAAVSVVSNIAEGHERNTRGEFLQFLGQARGSLAEVDTQTRLASRLDLTSKETSAQFAERIAEVGRLLNGLRRSLAQQ